MACQASCWMLLQKPFAVALLVHRRGRETERDRVAMDVGRRSAVLGAALTSLSRPPTSDLLSSSRIYAVSTDSARFKPALNRLSTSSLVRILRDKQAIYLGEHRTGCATTTPGRAPAANSRRARRSTARHRLEMVSDNSRPRSTTSF